MDIELFQAMFSLRETVVRDAIRHLCLPQGSSGLDAGCNIGLITKLLCETVSPGGRVTGLDIEEQYLRLCSPESPDVIIDNPDYYAYFTYTMFEGAVP